MDSPDNKKLNNLQESGEIHRQNMDDEISLIDLALVLARYKMLIAGVFVLCVVAGGGWAFARTDKYGFSSIIEIGTISQGNDGSVNVSLLESLEAVKAKLDASYIPLAQSELFEAGQTGKQTLYGLSAKVPKGSQIVVLESQGPVKNQAVYRELHEKAIEFLQNDHQRILKVPKKQYELQLAEEVLKLKQLEDPKFLEVQEKELKAKIEQAGAKLQSLKDDVALTTSRFAQLEKNRELLKEQIAETQSIINDAKENRMKAVSEAKNEAKAMTLLMIDNQIEQNRTRLAALKERLYVDFVDKEEQLTQQKQANLRSQNLQKIEIDELKTKLQRLYLDHQQKVGFQKQEIARVKNRLDNLQPTRTLGVAMSSLQPVGPGKALILALAGMIGLMGGVMLAFLAEFLRKVR